MNLDELLSALQGARDLFEVRGELPKCRSCQATNRATAVFCATCGERLTLPCPGCDRPCRIPDRYCDWCGRELVASEVAESIEKHEAAEHVRASDPMRAFTDLRKIGEGRTVRYHARRSGDDRFLKVAETEDQRRLLQNEAEALQGVRHPNVVHMFEHREHRDRTLLELEWIESAKLRFPLSIGRLTHLMLGVAEALKELHANDLVHCDLKPDNVLVRKSDGHPVLIDFEASQRRGEARVSGYTPMFAAPEQVFGDRVDMRADVYAFGVTLYLLFSYDRLPSLLDPESRAQREMEKILKAKVARAGHHLSGATIYGSSSPDREARAARAAWRKQLPAGAASSEAQILGAKYFFAGELQRIADVNRDLDRTHEILSIIASATEVDPDRRPRDGGELAARMRDLSTGLGAE